ncbi:peroxiredoxin [Hydrogenovibrio sp. 3SP14C1]|uniref:peroxiredoxin n=1 Tax=Hydrogenovibrio sp. 3SP14C1 TaxID=3038774 RepID=UPI0024170C33|nr:peroxiredoxin [Hydrogenovibrio sp. 3SP14C1]MDG4813137.1 peroxiredoxin [Hydrogenovibrio sp. 3SP14C1]
MFQKLTLFALTIASFSAQANPLKIGDLAPGFTLYNQHQEQIKLSGQQGKWVVLYFYPKNDTPGCTTEACSFRDNVNKLIQKKAVILGVSLDSLDSHQAFAKKYQLPFSLLSDSEGNVAAKYGALSDFIVFKFAKRHSFIIDPSGHIVKIYRDVDPQEHVGIVLKELNTLQNAKH